MKWVTLILKVLAGAFGYADASDRRRTEDRAEERGRDKAALENQNAEIELRDEIDSAINDASLDDSMSDFYSDDPVPTPDSNRSE